MRSLDELAALARGRDIRVHVDADRLQRAVQTPDDVLFQVPLLALTMLVVARGKKGVLHTADMTTWTCATLACHFRTASAPHRHVDWSIALRRRCADALVFLESVALVAVIDAPPRSVRATAKGLDFLRKSRADTADRGLLVRALERAYRTAESTGLELL